MYEASHPEPCRCTPAGLVSGMYLGYPREDVQDSADAARFALQVPASSPFASVAWEPSLVPQSSPEVLSGRSQRCEGPLD